MTRHRCVRLLKGWRQGRCHRIANQRPSLSIQPMLWPSAPQSYWIERSSPIWSLTRNLSLRRPMTGLFHIVERIHADHVVAVAPIFEGARSTELSSSTIEIAKTARQVSAAGISTTVFTFDASGQLAEWVTAPDALTADGRALHHALRSLLADHQHRFFAIFEAITVVLT